MTEIITTSSSSLLKRKPTTLLQFILEPTKISRWTCLNPDIKRSEAIDCTINSLHFLDVIKDRKEAEDFSRKIQLNDNNLSMKGIGSDTFIELLEKYTPENYIMMTMYINKNRDNSYTSWISLLNKKIKPGNATFVLYNNQDNSGHVVIAYKDIKNELYILDTQQLTSYTGNNEIKTYFTKENINVLHLIYLFPKKTRKYSARKMKIRKSSTHSDRKTRKRRRLATHSQPKSLSFNNKKRKRSTTKLKIRKSSTHSDRKTRKRRRLATHSQPKSSSSNNTTK